MKRDMDLVRKLLFRIEETYIPGEKEIDISDLQIDGYDSKTISEHLTLMYDAGLLQDMRKKTYITGEMIFGVGNLTNKGYDTLEEFRSDTVWNKTKEVVQNQGLPVVLDVFKSVASTVISSITEGVIKSMK